MGCRAAAAAAAADGRGTGAAAAAVTDREAAAAVVLGRVAAVALLPWAVKSVLGSFMAVAGFSILNCWGKLSSSRERVDEGASQARQPRAKSLRETT